MSDVLEISCDEAGFTGPDLLQKDQRYFAFASVSVADEEAYATIQKARSDFPVQMPELKASKLMATEQGRNLISSLVKSSEGRFAVSLFDKLLALCGWVFEYLYEPVYYRAPQLLYEKNLHRFVAMYTWLWLTDERSEAKRFVEEFQKYMRSRDPKDAPFLFATKRKPLTQDGSAHPFEPILHFAYGYRDRITADNRNIDTNTPDGGRWTLDLSASSLWSHLNHWGRKNKPLLVRCDDSKPLKALAPQFTGDENDPGIRRARQFHREGEFGWTLLKPVEFVDSRGHPAVQLADTIAGATSYLIANGTPRGFEEAADLLRAHALRDSVMPDFEVIDPHTRAGAVNAMMLYDLAKRAERQGDPYENLAEMYHAAEVGWASGKFDELLNKKAR